MFSTCLLFSLSNNRGRARAGSRPIDLDDLTARLQHVSGARQALSEPPSLHTVDTEKDTSESSPSLRSRETTASLLDEEEEYRRVLKHETKFYNTIIREGGQPSHSASLGRDILDDPGELREILLYWQRDNGDAEGRRVWWVFGSQFCRWKDFREYQRTNRDQGRFPTYNNTVERSLARHGFTRPFKLDEDPERQDKLTTWIEYLDYEFWLYDKDMRIVKRLQPQYDAAWNQLVDAQVLRTFETEEFICDVDSAFQRGREEERAEKAVEASRLGVTTAERAISDPRRSHLSEQALRQRLATAESKLDAANKSLKSIKRRNDLVHEFLEKVKLPSVSYVSAKEDAEWRSILLRWILQQIPIIERQLNHAKVAENTSAGEDAGVKRTSKRDRADESTEGRQAKRQRRDGEISNCRTRASTAEERESQPDRGRSDFPNQGRGAKVTISSQSTSLSARNTSDATSNEEPVASRVPATQELGATLARSARARSLRYSAPKKTILAVQIPPKVILEEKARVTKAGRRARKSGNLSAPRRSTRVGKPPDRFQ